MRNTEILNLLLAMLIIVISGSCEPDEETEPTGAEGPTGEVPGGGEIPNTPFTSIPDALVGTWYTSDNKNPLTINWEEGTFQGEEGFDEYLTMVFTKDGKNAVEYFSEDNGYGKFRGKIMIKRIGTLAYNEEQGTLTFYSQSSQIRTFDDETLAYEEYDLTEEDKGYKTTLIHPEVSTYTHGPNYLIAQRTYVEGRPPWDVQYTKVEDDTQGGEVPNPNVLYSTPPATGTYVEIAGKYYPTVSIGKQEWMSVNYAGLGGLNEAEKPHYGTYLKYADLDDIPLPAGWRIPTQQDYMELLASQGLVWLDWGSTDGDDVQSKKRLGQLMATSDWLKEDGYASNASGFNAVPSNRKVLGNGEISGEGTNCYLWTSAMDEYEAPIAFEIVQLPSSTYASFTTFPLGYYPQHLPLRLVRNK